MYDHFFGGMENFQTSLLTLSHRTYLLTSAKQPHLTLPYYFLKTNLPILPNPTSAPKLVLHNRSFLPNPPCLVSHSLAELPYLTNLRALQ